MYLLFKPSVMTLCLHSRFILELNNCYFVSKLRKNIISESCFISDSYSYKSMNNGCSIYYENMLYGFAPMVGGLFILDPEREKYIYTLMLNVLRRLIIPHTCGTVFLVILERNVCKSFRKMECWLHFI